MERIDKKLKFNTLLSTYGVLLSITQKEILESYYFYDLSISEIANERNVSRAAIEDALQKGNQKLEEYESLLHLLDKKEELSSLLLEIKNKTKDEDLLKIIEEMERKL